MVILKTFFRRQWRFFRRQYPILFFAPRKLSMEFLFFFFFGTVFNFRAAKNSNEIVAEKLPVVRRTHLKGKELQNKYTRKDLLITNIKTFKTLSFVHDISHSVQTCDDCVSSLTIRLFFNIPHVHVWL